MLTADPDRRPSGFGQLGTFGGPIPTAEPRQGSRPQGLRYNQFSYHGDLLADARGAAHGARNHHESGVWARFTELSTGYPGLQTGVWGQERRGLSPGGGAGRNGFYAAGGAFGKMAPTRRIGRTSPIGPGSTAWPTGLGFEILVRLPRGVKPVNGSRSSSATRCRSSRPRSPEAGAYHFYPRTMTRRRPIAWIQARKVDRSRTKPFFRLFSRPGGSARAPWHAPKEWIDKFKGKFDQGWDKGPPGKKTLERQKRSSGVVAAETRQLTKTFRPRSRPWGLAICRPEKRLLPRRHQEVFPPAILAHTRLSRRPIAGCRSRRCLIPITTLINRHRRRQRA